MRALSSIRNQYFFASCCIHICISLDQRQSQRCPLCACTLPQLYPHMSAFDMSARAPLQHRPAPYRETFSHCIVTCIRGTDMIKKSPHKIDMGAVYTKEPNQKAYISKDAFKEVSREFILDIDLTDYQEDGTIKSNCIDPTDADFCKSWKFMAIACEVFLVLTLVCNRCTRPLQFLYLSLYCSCVYVSPGSFFFDIKNEPPVPVPLFDAWTLMSIDASRTSVNLSRTQQ